MTEIDKHIQYMIDDLKLAKEAKTIKRKITLIEDMERNLEITYQLIDEELE